MSLYYETEDITCVTDSFIRTTPKVVRYQGPYLSPLDDPNLCAALNQAYDRYRGKPRKRPKAGWRERARDCSRVWQRLAWETYLGRGRHSGGEWVPPVDMQPWGWSGDVQSGVWVEPSTNFVVSPWPCVRYSWTFDASGTGHAE